MKLVKFFPILMIVAMSAATAFAQQAKPVAENFSGLTMDGQTVELESLRGKVVLLTFWSTRCAICISELPKLNQMASEYAGRDVVLLGLTTDNPTMVESFVRNRPFNFNLMPGSFGTLLKYADRDRSGNLNMGFPAYFVINQNGEIELKASGWDKTAAVSRQINRLLLNAQAKIEE